MHLVSAKVCAVAAILLGSREATSDSMRHGECDCRPRTAQRRPAKLPPLGRRWRISPRRASPTVFWDIPLARVCRANSVSLPDAGAARVRAPLPAEGPALPNSGAGGLAMVVWGGKPHVASPYRPAPPRRPGRSNAPPGRAPRLRVASSDLRWRLLYTQDAPVIPHMPVYSTHYL